MFQLLQILWRGGWMVFIVYHKGPTWCGCSLLTNLAILQPFRSPTSLSCLKGYSTASFSLWFQHPVLWGSVPGVTSRSISVTILRLRGNQLRGLVPGLGPLLLFALYANKCWWIMSPVPSRLRSRAATGTSVWKSGWEVKRWGPRTAHVVQLH